MKNGFSDRVAAVNKEILAKNSGETPVCTRPTNGNEGLQCWPSQWHQGWHGQWYQGWRGQWNQGSTYGSGAANDHKLCL